MAENGAYAKLSCETVPDGKGRTEIMFSGTTKNAPPPADNGDSTQFSGVLDAEGNIKGNYKEIDRTGETVLSASTDGSGFSNHALEGQTQEDRARIAGQALSAPAKACTRLPWPANG